MINEDYWTFGVPKTWDSQVGKQHSGELIVNKLKVHKSFKKVY